MESNSVDWTAFAHKDKDERDQAMLHALVGGRTCDEINASEQRDALCRRLAPQVKALQERGMLVVPSERDQ